MRLSDYAIDATTGFVPATAPLAQLPEAFAPWELLVPQLSALIRGRRIREALSRLPVLDVGSLTQDAERERALLLLCVFTNSWVWGGDGPHLRVPASVAVPACAIAQELRRPPITHYASMALNNWQLLDPHRELSTDNARMQVQFFGGVDEDWFFMASIGVELAGAPLLPLIATGVPACSEGTDGELARIVEELGARMTAVCAALERVRIWCDPQTYYLRVRPFLSGWPDPGLVYEGVDEVPRKYVGGSAGQSSLLQALDAFLGIDHGDSFGGRYLRAIRAYMPVGHRAFVEDVERASRVRARVSAGGPQLRKVYNDTLDQIVHFRALHGALAQDYIVKPSGVAADDRGTGGTSVASFLSGTHAVTARSRL